MIKNKYVLKKRLMVLDYLGNKCVRCNESNKELLQIDHINSDTKSFDISHNYNRRWSFLLEELKKCQILCIKCHKDKSKSEKDHCGGQNKWKSIVHGKNHAYKAYKCRCDLCILGYLIYRYRIR